MESLKSRLRTAISLGIPEGVLTRAPAFTGTRFMARAALAARFRGKPFTMVNVGACDGVLFDDMTPWLKKIPGARAVLVEPVPYNREKLRANYPDEDRFVIEPVAITAKKGKMKIRTFEVEALESGKLPKEFVGCSSVTDTNIISGKDAWGTEDANYSKYEPYFTDLEVDTDTFDNMMQRNHISKIDALLIDCEGADWIVLEQVDLERYRPGMVKIEIGSLSATDVGNVIVKLKTAGYTTGIHAEDVWAFPKNS